MDEMKTVISCQLSAISGWEITDGVKDCTLCLSDVFRQGKSILLADLYTPGADCGSLMMNR